MSGWHGGNLGSGQAQQIWYMGMSDMPDRPMHPNAKMSGGDRPYWDEMYRYMLRKGKIKQWEDMPDVLKDMKEHWLNLPKCDDDKYNCSDYTIVVTGEING